MIWQLFVGVVIIYGFVLRWKARHRIKFSKSYTNSVKSLPVLGYSFWFLNCKSDKDRWSILEMFSRETVKQGGMTCFWNLHKLYLMVADPVVAECVTKHCLEKDDAMKLALGSLLGNGSIIADVPIWRPRRKVLVPTFNHKNLLNFTEIFSKQSLILVEQLQKVAGRGSFSLSQYILAYSMDTVSEIAFGITANAQQNPNQKVLKAFMGSFQLVSDRIIKPWLHFNPIYKLTADYTQFMEYVDIITTFINKAMFHIPKETERSLVLNHVILDKRRELAENNDLKKDDDRFKPFLELMIESSGGEKGYNNKELLEELMVVFTAASDTTTLGSSFTSVLLARHPEVQEKVYQELKKVFGDSDRPVTAEDLTHLKYMDAVIKETLRLYPPAPVLLRKVDNDIVLPSRETLPKDTGIMISLFGTNRNPRYWGDDVEMFRPERFIDTQLKHPAAFLSFSYGPRNCVGYRYAMMSMKTVLATFLRQFRVLPVSKLDLGKPLDLKLDVMLRATDDFQVIFEPRRV